MFTWAQFFNHYLAATDTCLYTWLLLNRTPSHRAWISYYDIQQAYFPLFDQTNEALDEDESLLGGKSMNRWITQTIVEDNQTIFSFPFIVA